MKSAYWPIMIFGLCLALLVSAGLVGCSKPSPDPAAWQRWVYDLTKDRDPNWWKPGSTAALIQFGYDYCSQHDRQRRLKDGIDGSTVGRLREDLVRKGVPVNSTDGVAMVDAAAEGAQKTLCP
jgi:hypothetical protein